MEHIKNIKLEQLVGVWVAIDGNYSMQITDDAKMVVVNYDYKTLVSEYTKFSYDEVRNICVLSDSVILNQLFEDGDICIKVNLYEQQYLLFLRRRNK